MGSSAPPKKEHIIPTFRPMSIVAKRSPISAAAKYLLIKLQTKLSWLLFVAHGVHGALCSRLIRCFIAYATYYLECHLLSQIIYWRGAYKPRLHDTTCCQTGCQTALTTGCIVYTNIQPVVKNRIDNRLYRVYSRLSKTRFDNRLNEQ